MPHKIMVIDDTALARESVAKLLEYEGFETLKASNGRDGWAMMYNDTPDLILLDLMMPGMDGITFLRMLRRSPLWKDLPVIVLTGASDDQKLVTRAWELGIRDLVPKASFGFDELLAQIRKNLRPASEQPSESTSVH
jgi:two-component system phosphate regulon response regulator PhoB